MNNDVRRLVMSWPKLRVLSFRGTPISLSALRIVAERCPDLQELYIHLDASTISASIPLAKALATYWILWPMES